MKLTGIAPDDEKECKSGDCPTIYMTDRGTIAVHGYNVEHLTPEGESVVEIPLGMLLEAARALGR